MKMKLLKPIYLNVLLIVIAQLPNPIFPQNNGKLNDYPGISGFHDSSHHWYDIKDDEQIINPLPGKPRYDSSDFKSISENILLYQKSNGGWPKNYDMLAILTNQQKEILLKAKDEINVTTFDNGATYNQIEYLAKVYKLTGDERYGHACLNGINFILSAQYANGGWPQFYPDTSGYRKYITFNDGAMVGVMRLLLNIIQNRYNYKFINDEWFTKVKASFDKGLDCILNCQILQNGRLSAWCQQHDNIDLRPQSARTFEPASICSRESVLILKLLMKIRNPDKRVINSIKSSVKWFRDSKIEGIRINVIDAPPLQFQYRYSKTDRVVVKDIKAPPIWARMYDISTNRPVFCNRDGKIVFSLAEVQRERRDGYTWYNYDAESVFSKYPNWLKKWGK